MRILMANEAYAGGGGVETYLAALVPALQARGHEVGVLHDNRALESGPQPIAPPGTWHVGVQDEQSLDRALERVRAFAPDVCFSHNMRRLEIDARLADEWPVVKMMHGHFGTCVSGQKAFLFPDSSPCPRTFGPGCAAHYFPRRCGEANPATLVRSYRWGLRQRSLFRRYHAMVVASRYMRDEYMRAGAAPERVVPIPLFAPLEVPALAIDRARPIDVLFLGRLTPLKGPDVLVDAVAEAGRRLGRPLSLVVAGEGPLRRDVQQRAARAGVRATVPGWVGPGERDRLLREAAVLAVPSRWHEPFGLVGLEAAAYGVPAVAFATGGVAEWLHDGVTGRLVDASSGASGMALALVEMLSGPDLYRRLADGALAAARRMTLASYVDLLTAVLAEAAAGPLARAS
jgi:glycosyltransferase involved in cell wall biosynthesis